MADLTKLMKQAQEMQSKMQLLQKEIANKELVGEAGGGLVKVTVNGRHEVKKIEVDPSVWAEAQEVILDLVIAAINKANLEIEKFSKDKLGALASNLNLPPDLMGS